MAATIDDALDILHRTGPELVGGNSNHGPMVAEVWCAKMLSCPPSSQWATQVSCYEPMGESATGEDQIGEVGTAPAPGVSQR
jgi:hypothetical protein